MDKDLLKIYFFIGIAIFAYFFMFDKSVSMPQGKDLGRNWDNAILLNKPIIAYFYTLECGSCKVMTPVIGQVAQQVRYKYTYLPINCNKKSNAPLTKAFKIEEIPTIYLINPKTKKVEKLKAVPDQTILKDQLKQFLEEQKAS